MLAKKTPSEVRGFCKEGLCTSFKAAMDHHQTFVLVHSKKLSLTQHVHYQHIHTQQLSKLKRDRISSCKKCFKHQTGTSPMTWYTIIINLCPIVTTLIKATTETTEAS